MTNAQIIGFAFFIGTLAGITVGMAVSQLSWFQGER